MPQPPVLTCYRLCFAVWLLQLLLMKQCANAAPELVAQHFAYMQFYPFLAADANYSPQS